MSWQDFTIVFLVCAITMFVCRVVPLVFLKDRQLPEKLQKALNLIPSAAFAALVANDLFNPQTFTGDIWQAAIPFVACVVVIVIARLSKSLLWCAICGVCVYAMLTYLVV